MTAAALLAALRRRGVELWADGDRLGYRAPRGALTPELREAVAARKAELLELLRGGNNGNGHTMDGNGPACPAPAASYRVLANGRVVAEAHTKDEAVSAFDETIRDIARNIRARGRNENQVTVELVAGNKRQRVAYFQPLPAHSPDRVTQPTGSGPEASPARSRG